MRMDRAKTEMEIIQNAIDLTAAHDSRVHDTLSYVWWVCKDGDSTDGDYCSECVGGALEEKMHDYKVEQYNLPIEERDEELSEFETDSCGGDYESSSFVVCDNCGKDLICTILPDRCVYEDLIDDIEEGMIDDNLGRKIHRSLLNMDGIDSKGLELAKKTIDALNRS